MKKIFGIVLTIFGGFFLVFALLFGLIFGSMGVIFSGIKDDTDYTSDEYASCEGVVTEADSSPSQTTISYEVDGQTYEFQYNGYSSFYEEGKTVVVYYEIANPRNATAPEIMDQAFGIVGGLFSGLGIMFVVIFGVVGLGMLIGGILLLKSAKKDEQTVSI